MKYVDTTVICQKDPVPGSLLVVAVIIYIIAVNMD